MRSRDKLKICLHYLNTITLGAPTHNEVVLRISTYGTPIKKDTKLRKVLIYFERLPPLKSHDPLITWSKFISPLSQNLRPLNLAGWLRGGDSAQKWLSRHRHFVVFLFLLLVRVFRRTYKGFLICFIDCYPGSAWPVSPRKILMHSLENVCIPHVSLIWNFVSESHVL